MKKIVLIFFVALTVFSINVNATDSNINIVLNGQQIQFDVPPISIQNRVMIPLRKIFELLGAKVEWDEESKTAIGTKADKSIIIELGSSKATVNGKVLDLDVPAIEVDERILVPLRFVSENLGADISWNEKDSLVSIKYTPKATGNTQGNRMNYGRVSHKNDWIYFSFNKSGLIKEKLDGTEQQQICTDNAEDINIIGDYIYYTFQDDNDKQTAIYKIKVDGTEREKISNVNARWMHIMDNWIYYSDGDDSIQLYRLSIDGAIKEKISSYPCSYISISNGWIYFENEADKSKLYKMKLDGSEMQKLCDDYDYSLNVNVVGDMVYYSKEGTDYGLYKIDINGKGRTLLDKCQVFYLNVVDDWVYYTIFRDGIYKIKTDGTQKTKLLGEEAASYLNIANGWIYYNIQEYNYSSDKYSVTDKGVYKIKTDGSNNIQIIEGQGILAK